MDFNSRSPRGVVPAANLSATGKVAPGDKKVPVMGITLAGGPINSKRDITFFSPLPISSCRSGTIQSCNHHQCGQRQFEGEGLVYVAAFPPDSGMLCSPPLTGWTK